MTVRKLRAALTAILLGTAAASAGALTLATPAAALTVSAKVGPLVKEAQAMIAAKNYKGAAAKLSELYPEYPLPIGYGDDGASPPSSSAQRTDAKAGGLAGVFAKLPRPPSRTMRLALILAVATGVAFVFAGVTVIMSVSADRAAMFAPDNAR